MLVDYNKGKVDITTMMYSIDRARKYKMGPTIKFTSLYAVCRKDGNAKNYNYLKDFIGKRVGLEKDMMPYELVLSHKIKCNISLFHHLVDGLKSLSAGKYDVILCDNEAAIYYIMHCHLYNLEVRDVGIAPSEMCFVGIDEKLLSRIDDELYQMKRDGTYDKIYSKWFDHSPLSKVSRIIYIVIGSLILIVLLLYIVVHVLRREIEKAKKLLKENNEKLKSALTAARSANDLKSVFLANMSHEIRTPLNSIVGFSNLLGEDISDADREMFIKLVNQNSEQLLVLINDILDFSKLEAGNMDFHISEFDFSDMFKVAYSSLAVLADGKDVEFRCEVPSSPCMVRTDYNRMLQVLTNFVTNAFKYTEHGYVKIAYSRDAGGVKFTVEDTGMGIPSEKLGMVFKRFEKLGSSRQGTGLGMSISRSIIDMLGGCIGVESVVSKGSTFWAWIPMEAKPQDN